MKTDMARVVSTSSMAEVILEGYSMQSLLLAMLRPNLLRLLGGWSFVLAALLAVHRLAGIAPGAFAGKSRLTLRSVLAALAMSVPVYAALLMAPSCAWPGRVLIGGFCVLFFWLYYRHRSRLQNRDLRRGVH